MAKNPNSQTTSATNATWRSGRPSFKAFYPEIFLLTLVTIAFIAVAINFSCRMIRDSKGASVAAVPISLDVDATLTASFAFAQDASLDEMTSVPEERDDAVETVGPETSTSVPVVVSEEKVETVALPVSEADSDAAPTPKPQKESVMMKILWVWIVCLFVPTVLWIWRGIVWISAVWGVYYELRVDPDNPRETTFLTTRGIFNKTTDSLHIGSVKDIRSKQTFFQKYFMGGVGTVILFTKDLTDGRVEMKNMAEPSRVFNAFDDLKRHYWGRGGMQLHDGSEEDGAFEDVAK